MKKNIYEMAQLFDVLSNEVRLCILLNLFNNQEKNVGGLQNCAKVSQSVVSQQLAKLKLNQIICCKKVGNEVFYSICDEDIKIILKTLLENSLEITK